VREKTEVFGEHIPMPACHHESHTD